MLKSLKELKTTSIEKNLASQLIRELAQMDKLSFGDESEMQEDDNSKSLGLSYRTLASGRRVYCPNRQNPVRNRKHLVRSLLIH